MNQEKTIIDAEHELNEIFTRGASDFIDPNNTFKQKVLKHITGEYKKPIIIKFGVDPTRPDIHLGHAVVFRKLRALQNLGCKVVFLIGDYTAMIGDPTGKSKVRPEVDFAEVERNTLSFLEQIDKILKVEKIEKATANGGAGGGKNVQIKITDVFGWIRNSDWFLSVTDIQATQPSITITGTNNSGHEASFNVNANSFIGKAALYDINRMQKKYRKDGLVDTVTILNILRTMRSITHAQLIERDMFQDRIKQGLELYTHELLYPVLQGLDSLLLHKIFGSCDLEVGGSDQTFNMLMGRQVMKVNEIPQQSVLAFNLLTGTDGKEKMSKSLDNYIAINDAPHDMYGKIMSIPDELMESYFELCTFKPIDEIKQIIADIKKNKVNPRDVKMKLAREIVVMYHGEKAGETAENDFIETFRNAGIPNDTQTFNVKKGDVLCVFLKEKEFISSNTEFKRLVDGGALSVIGGDKITDCDFKITQDLDLKIGKHRFVKIRVV